MFKDFDTKPFKKKKPPVDSGYTTRTEINELKKIDLVIDSGQRTKSKYGRDCVLWQRKDQINNRGK